MGEIMNSPNGMKSGVPEIVQISAPHVAPATIHCYITGNQSDVTVCRQTVQHM